MVVCNVGANFGGKDGVLRGGGLSLFAVCCFANRKPRSGENQGFEPIINLIIMNPNIGNISFTSILKFFICREIRYFAENLINMSNSGKSKSSGEDANNEVKEKGKSCFIITPIGKVGSETFVKAEGLINAVITPILLEFGYYANPAHRIDSTGSITKQIINRIIDDDIVIANLTGNNPNVMYELAIRHSYNKKVITMAERDTVLPFDISDQRTIFYDDTLSGSEAAKIELRQKFGKLKDDESISNPVMDAVKEAAIITSAKEGSIEPTTGLEYLIERFDRLERELKASARGNLRSASTDNRYRNVSVVISPNPNCSFQDAEMTAFRALSALAKSPIGSATNKKKNEISLDFVSNASDEQIFSAMSESSVFNLRDINSHVYVG